MTGKIKIAIFHCGFIYSGGGERIVFEQARGLKKRGYEVVIYAPTLNPKISYPEFIQEFQVKTFLPSYFSRLPLRNALRMIVTSMLAFLFSYKFKSVDIFIGANQPGAWMAFCISKVLNKPYIVYLNQPNRLLFPRPVDIKFGWFTTEKGYQLLYYLIRWLRPFTTFIDKLSVNSSKHILVNGTYIGGIIENIYGKKTVNCPAGAYANSYQKLYLNPHINNIYSGKIQIKQFNIQKPYLLITNRHDPQKRFDLVLQAFKKVLIKYPDLRLVIPGPFTVHTQNLITIAKKLNILEKTIFIGQIKESELQKLYQNSAVYCYPSPEEDFGLGPLEAGGWGIPTVAWNFAGPTVTVSHNVSGFLANPYDINDYADKILQLLFDKKLRLQMGKKAWERTKNEFSWDKHITNIENHIKKYI